MALIKLKYLNNDGSENINISKRAEFFAHYWQFVFNIQNVSYDSYYLKSHRTIIEKIRLQIEGNYENAKNRVEYFFVKDQLFDARDIIIKQLTGTKTRRAITDLKKFVNLTQNQWKLLRRSKINTRLNTLQSWLKRDYAKLISKSLINLLEKDAVLNLNDIEKIKELVNCFIIELFHHGFSAKFIQDLPEALNDWEKFPYEKMATDFDNKEQFDEYKKDTWNSLSLKKQIEGIITILNRSPRSRLLVFRIDDINWRVPPLKFFDVEFYNPANQPKIDPGITFKVFEETFTLNPVPYDQGSRCNACVRIFGLQEQQMYKLGFNRVKPALDMLNKELNVHGKVYPNGVFMTNNDFSRIWGSSNAIHRGFVALDEIKPDAKNRLKYLQKLKLKNTEDKKVFDLFSIISSEVHSIESFNPERIWMILEATLHAKEKEMINIFNCISKIYLRYNFDKQWRNILNHNLYNTFLHADIDYVVTNKQAAKFSIDGKRNTYSLIKFRKNIPLLSMEMPTPFITNTISHIQEYHSNKVLFYPKMERYIEYIITELYAQRNLSFHSNMSDEFFLLKQKELKTLINIFAEVFFHWYFKYPKHRSIPKTISRIAKKAATL